MRLNSKIEIKQRIKISFGTKPTPQLKNGETFGIKTDCPVMPVTDLYSTYSILYPYLHILYSVQDLYSVLNYFLMFFLKFKDFPKY